MTRARNTKCGHKKQLFHLIRIQGLKKKSLHKEVKDICHLEDTFLGMRVLQLSRLTPSFNHI